MMRNTADAVVIGGGVMGCSLLYHLAQRGTTDTLLLERSVLGAGSTGLSQAICRMHYSNPITASMAWSSLQVYANFNEQVGGDSGFVKTGYLVVVEEIDRPSLELNIAMQQDLGIDVALVTAGELHELAPMIETFEGESLAWEPNSGYANPYLVTTSLAARAQELGAQVATRANVTGVEISGGRVQAVVTDQGRVATPVAVVAAGPWSNILTAGAGIEFPLVPVRHQVAMVTRSPGLLPDHPIVGDIAQSFSFRPESPTLTMVGYAEEEVELDSYDEGIDHAEAAHAMARLARRMPAMEQSYLRGGWSGLFTTTPDWHPILDRVPGIEGLFCMVGFSGHGFKLAPSIGQAMAELILDGSAGSIDLSPLRFSRFEENDLILSRYRYRVLA
ncbi:MAG: FAD-dependent oxidoreductase [Chloroflexi bacterium]|nr:FAD-dependent oxidoreductase [Chloroflexota bacterium]